MCCWIWFGAAVRVLPLDRLVHVGGILQSLPWLTLLEVLTLL
jgi:hypothetical protein